MTEDDEDDVPDDPSWPSLFAGGWNASDDDEDDPHAPDDEDSNETPSAPHPETTMSTFALDPPTEEMVRYENALLFRAGDYSDKSYAMTTAELAEAAEDFQAVPNVVDHVAARFGIPTIFDGKLGHVESVRLSGDGTELRGTVAIPKWLDTTWTGGPKQVSCEWDRKTKRLRALGLVVKGRVPDAALMAAFSAAHLDTAPALFSAAHRTPQGSMALQELHDHAARHGAVCDPDNSAAFASSRERSGIQKVHDLTTEHGAKCSVMSGAKPAMYGANPSSKGKIMSMKEKFLALFSGRAEQPPDAAVEAFLSELTASKVTETETPPVVKTVVATFADSPEARAMQKQIDDLKAANRLKDITSDAATFADAEITAARALPSERADLIAVFTQAALDDHDHTTVVTFSDNSGKPTTGNRVAALKALHGRRPSHGLLKEYIGQDNLPDSARVLFADRSEKKDEFDAARHDRLLAMTSNGQAAIARRNGAK